MSGQSSEGIAQLNDVLRLQPDHIKANYELGLVLRAQHAILHHTLGQEPSHTDAAIRNQFVATLGARAFTDEDYTTQANAAFELQQYDRARTLYAEALAINRNAVYALSGRASLYARTHQYQLAVYDLKAALALHPREPMLADALRQLLHDKRPARLTQTAER